MDTTKFTSDILPKINQCRTHFEKVSSGLGDTNQIVLIESQGLYEDVIYGLQSMLRKLPASQGLDLILESHGGSIDSASTIASLCRERFGKLRVIIPFMAKSAATLIALTADERILTCFTQLGPVDPQVRHPQNPEMWFPAHSIKEALEQVENTKDKIVKMAMADKLDPFLIGAFRDAMAASKQYIEEVVERWDVPNKADIVSAFTDKYKSHGYPIDSKVLKSLNVPFTSTDSAIEDSLFDLHEICVDIVKKDVDEGILIMTKSEYLFISGDFVNRGNLGVSNNKKPPQKSEKAS
jgi:hypothetical protein